MSNEVWVVETAHGFTSLDKQAIDALVKLGLIRYRRSGHVIVTGDGRGVGAMHHFYFGEAVEPAITSTWPLVP